ncbi:MAG: ATP-binding protein, partial [Pseudomonadota bacterium]
PSQYEEDLNPFSRLDPARNQNRNGVGLGLSIARDVARSHGGDITMSKSPLGGLRVTLRLPLKT